jgi:predicted ATPase
MKIKSLYIRNFKNLQDFSIDFDTEQFVTIIIGENGTGKSNLLEALILIFRDLDLGDPPAFAYRLHYFCRQFEIEIDADPERSGSEAIKIQVREDDETENQEQAIQPSLLPKEPSSFNEIPYPQFKRDAREKYLPRYVFGYYSGPSNRMETHFEKHQERFYRDLIREKKSEEPPLRPLLYARHVHSQFVLLSFFTEQDAVIIDFLRRNLRVEGMDSVLFVMRQPSWKSKEGDPRFWNARGVVQVFLDCLHKLALAPLVLKFRVNVGFRNTKTLEHLYLYLKDDQSLEELLGRYPSQQEFFKALESTYISELLSEARIKVKVRNADGSLTYQEMSEGEQQLLMVLGLLRFTKEEESLFLLDEPDTHLNPAWSVQYLDFLKDVVGEQPTSHVLMTTHDPLVVAGVASEQVKMLYFSGEAPFIRVMSPEDDPNRMGYPEILTNIFHLPSIINPELTRLLHEKRVLASKERLTDEELGRLTELNEILEGFDFTSIVRDPDYGRFVKALAQQEAEEDLQEPPVLSVDERRRRMEMAREILQRLKTESGVNQ